MLTVDYARLGLRPGDRLLDLGCGAGRHAFEALRRGANVTALDLDQAELDLVAVYLAAISEDDTLPRGSGWETLQASATELPFPDAHFDRVIASEVLEHINDDALAIGELSRVLKPGGTMAVTVPRFGPELVNWLLSERYHSVEGGHVRIYRLSQLAGRLSASGLRVVGVGFAHALHSPYWWLKCLVGLEREDSWVVNAYHRFLVWDIEKSPRLTKILDSALNPLIGKSLVLYLEKPFDGVVDSAADFSAADFSAAEDLKPEFAIEGGAC